MATTLGPPSSVALTSTAVASGGLSVRRPSRGLGDVRDIGQGHTAVGFSEVPPPIPRGVSRGRHTPVASPTHRTAWAVATADPAPPILACRAPVAPGRAPPSSGQGTTTPHSRGAGSLGASP